MELTTIIVFLISVVVARHNHRTVLESILKSTNNLYTKVDNDVQKIMNNMFDMLNLSPNFPEKSRIKLLLNMHYDLNNMAAKNYDEHAKMLDAARPDTGNGSSKGVALLKLIDKSFDDKSFNQSYESKTSRELPILEDKIVERAASLSTATPSSLEKITPSDPVFADSKEFIQFIKGFIKKVGKLKEKDFSKSTPLLPPIEEVTGQPDEIELWQPPDFDNFNYTDSRRIFKGKRSHVKTYPFVVSIHLLGTFVCAGSIVASDMVLSAASCLQILHNNRFFRENPRAVEVRVGSDYFIRGGEMIPVLETFFYPSYNPKTLANNLVLLRLNRHIRFYKNEKRVKKIQYDRTKENLSINTDGIIVLGWGSRKRNNILEQFERIMVAKLDVYQINECAEIYSREFVTYRNFCAGFVSRGGGACNKDLGGPGIVGGLLVGVISFGAPMCGAIDAPTVFTKLGYYAEWIDTVINENGRALAVRTTLRYKTDKHYYYNPTTPTRENPYITYETSRGTVTPPTMYPENSKEELAEEYEPIVRGRLAPKIPMEQLFPYTPTTRYPMLLPIQLLRSIIYEDYPIFSDEDVSDMFKTSRQPSNVKDHPLVNLSLFAISGVYNTIPTSRGPKEKKYFTIRLTTAAGRTTKPPPWSSPPPPVSWTETIPDVNVANLVTEIMESDTPGNVELWVTTAEPDSRKSKTEGTTTAAHNTKQPLRDNPHYYYYDLLRV